MYTIAEMHDRQIVATAMVLVNQGETVTIYKAPQKRKGQKLLKEGFQPVDFPYNPPYADGNCYFAGPNDRSIAEEYNQSYKEGIL
ncbi:hypothetical protein [Scytonema sp. UIC 10036]|uniref:hypothetical protein n=1 Tax=Scytonema sp. UIC 10036 TaxID=2304196 RepID=UPI001FAAF324|nr:hypothetical protein [Scytonema sp. UIC 10036]